MVRLRGIRALARNYPSLSPQKLMLIPPPKSGIYFSPNGAYNHLRVKDRQWLRLGDLQKTLALSPELFEAFKEGIQAALALHSDALLSHDLHFVQGRFDFARHIQCKAEFPDAVREACAASAASAAAIATGQTGTQRWNRFIDFQVAAYAAYKTAMCVRNGKIACGRPLVLAAASQNGGVCIYRPAGASEIANANSNDGWEGSSAASHTKLRRCFWQ